MQDDSGLNETLVFGPFEWDPARAVLIRDGARLKLSGQPFEVLTILLEQADRLVTREELRSRLWGQRAFVDFEQGLNSAVARLRHVLGDSAERPHFIETVPGRGYRFIAPVLRRSATASDVPPEARPAIDRRAWLAGGLGLAIGAVGMYFAMPQGPASRSVGSSRFVVSGEPGPALAFSNGFQDLAISPDGRRIVYRTSVDGAGRLFTRPLEQLDGRLLPENDVFNPFFSPDGSEVGYYEFVGRRLLRASVLGGPASHIADIDTFVAGASWSADGSIVFGTLDARQGLMRVSAAGGSTEMLTTPAPGSNHVLPEVLPGIRAALFTIVPIEAPEASRIAVLDLDTGIQHPLVAGSHPRYAPSGHLLYLLEGNLMAARFDARRLRVEGESVVVVSGLATANGTMVPTGQYSLSRDGSLLVAAGGAEAQRRLVWVDRDGGEEHLAAPPGGYTYPRIAPDGRHIALNLRDERGGRIELWDVRRGDATSLTGGAGLSLYPVWLPDSRQIVYGAGVPLEHRLYRQAIERGTQPELLDSVPGAELRAPYFVTPAGRELVFARQGQGKAALMIASLVEPMEPRQLLAGARNADLSPDGQRMAYQSDESGRFEIYVRSFPDVGSYFTQVSSGGGIQPVWAPQGDALFYIEPGPPCRLMSVAVGEGFSLERPRPLVDWPHYTGELGRTYDVSRPDGARFLAVKKAALNDEQEGTSPRAEIVLDWLGELAGRFG